MKKASFGTLFLTVFLDLLGFGLVVPFLPRMARAFGANDFIATLLGASYSLMQLFLVPVWGRLSDRVGRRPVLLWSIAATSVSMLSLAFATSLPMLFASRIFAGIATANIAVAQAYIADVTPPHERARGMAVIGMSFGLGFILGPFFGGYLAQLQLWGRESSAPALVAAALSGINFFSALRTLPESLPADQRVGVSSQPRSHPFRIANWKRILERPGLFSALLVNLLVVASFSGLEQTFTLFTTDVFRLSTRAIGNIFGLIGIVAVVVQGGLIRPLSHRYGESRLIQSGVCNHIVAFAFLALSPRLGLGTVYACAVLFAIGNGLINPSISSYVSQHADPQTQGATLGVLQSTGALARALGPILAGALYQEVSRVAPYVSSAFGMGIGLLVALGLKPPGRGKTA